MIENQSKPAIIDFHTPHVDVWLAKLTQLKHIFKQPENVLNQEERKRYHQYKITTVAESISIEDVGLST